MRPVARDVGILLAALVAALGVVAVAPVPIPAALKGIVALAVSAGVGVVAGRAAAVRSACLVVLAVLLTVIGAETFLIWQLRDPIRKEVTPSDLTVLGGPLGYVAVPGQHVVERRYLGEQLLLEASYTIDGLGHRVVAGSAGADGPLVLMYGDSFTYGEGVNDDDTLPARLLAAGGGHCRPVNLGYPGYGPHQMLRALELDLDRGIVDAPVAGVVLLTGLFHVPRVAGLAQWDWYGPRYLLDGDGEPTHVGPFHEGRWGELLIRAGRLNLFRLARQAAVGGPHAEASIRLFVGVVQRAATLTRERYGVDLTVLFWDWLPVMTPEQHRLAAATAAALRASGLRVVKVSELITVDEGLFLPHDQHPNEAAFRRLAAALAPLVGCGHGNGTAAAGQVDIQPRR